MNGHWVKQTRKLNKHYQSGDRSAPIPLWGTAYLHTFGIGIGTNCFLALENDGIYPSTGDFKELIVPQGIYLANAGFTSILPLAMYDLSGVKIGSEDFSNLGSLIDPSGKVKQKYDTVNFVYTTVYGTLTFSRRMLIIYLDIADVELRQDGVSTKLKTYFNVKWNKPFRVPASESIVFEVDRRTGFYCLDDSNNPLTITDGAIKGSRRFWLDSNNTLRYFPPSVGSYFEFNTPITTPSGNHSSFVSPIFGGLSFGYRTQAASILDRSGSGGGVGANTAVFDNGYCIWRLIGIQTDTVPQGSTIRVYTNDFDTTQLRFNLTAGTISGTGNQVTRTTVTGWN